MGDHQLTREQALDLGLLVDMTYVACEIGFEMALHVSAGVVRAFGAAGLVEVVTVVARSTALLDGPAPVTIEMHAGPDLCAVREADGGGHLVTVTLADGG